ncbi:MAG: restriction endonuclease subunit S [Formivibrio sp.]|nr:restriction endonuclease subunit S [Formivibrio sp.]
MTSSWQKVTLAELIQIKHGYAFSGEFFSDSGPGDVLMTPGNFAIGGGFQWGKRKYYNGPVAPEYVLHPGDLVVTMTDLSKEADTLGYSAIVPTSPEKLLHNQRVGKVLKQSNAVALKYLHWLMRSTDYRNEVLATVTGSTVKHTSPSKILGYKFLLPPLGEQQSIASVLDSLSNKIELNQQMNETLEAMARAVFKDWFVDFGPTRSKAEGRPPYLAADLWSLFPDRLDDEGKPEGWAMQTLGDIFNIGIGRTPPRNEAVHFVPIGAGHTWLSIKNMGGLNIWACRSDENLARQTVKRLNIPVVPENTVVVSFKLTVGRVAITSHPMCTNEAIAHLVRPEASPFGPFYTYLYMANYDYGQLGSTSSIATAVNSKSIKSIKFLNPGKACLNAFEDMVTPIFLKIRTNLMETGTLAATRDLLLPKLMSGEIRVQDAEKALAAMA